MRTSDSLKDIKILEALIIKMKKGSFSTKEILASVYGAIRIGNALQELHNQGYLDCSGEIPKPIVKYAVSVMQVEEKAKQESAYINGSRFISRIKIARELFGWDLKFAKDWVTKHFMPNNGDPIPESA